MKRSRRSLVVIRVGLVVLIAGVIVQIEPWYEATSWQASPEAARARRNADALTPIWVTPTPAQASSAPLAPPAPPAPSASSPPQPRPKPTTVASVATTTFPVSVAQPTPTLGPSELQLTGSSFEFVDPPEPGAHARLSLSIHNPTEHASEPIVISLPLDWLAGYRVDSTQPPALDGIQDAGVLRLGVPGPEAGSGSDVSIDFTAIDEVIDPPHVDVSDAAGRIVGHAHPPTQAPTPRPGPIYAIDIPRLHLHSGVVPVKWDPPLFVVGQMKQSAYVTLGNSVLVGHLAGAAGYNVFNHLDQLEPGDDVIANSRGQSYDFVVSEKRVLPEDDATPTLPGSRPVLTLMTCAGDWNPLTRDFPDRLWVIAEPRNQATEEATPQPQREL